MNNLPLFFALLLLGIALDYAPEVLQQQFERRRNVRRSQPALQKVASLSVRPTVDPEYHQILRLIESREVDLRDSLVEQDPKWRCYEAGRAIMRARQQLGGGLYGTHQLGMLHNGLQE